MLLLRKGRYFRGGGTLANRASMSFILLGSFGVSTFPDIIRMPRPSFSTRKVVRAFGSLSLRSITAKQRVGGPVPETAQGSTLVTSALACSSP